MSHESKLDSAAFQQVIASQLPGLLGIELVELTPERITGRLPVKPAICTVGGIAHGGALMAFADTLGAIGTFVNIPPGARTTTIESSTKFIGAAAQGSVITGESLALHRGRTTMVWQTTIRDADGRLCAVVSQTQLVMEPRAG